MAETAGRPVRLGPGDRAPDLALPDQHGNVVRLADLRARKVLLYFYPKADTPGCTVQSCAVRDALRELAELGVVALGISPDPPRRQRAFDQKYRLGFPLLSDEDHAVAEAYGAWGEKTRYGRTYMGINRSSFLVDEDGRLLGSWYGVKPDETVPLARAAMDGDGESDGE